MEKSCYDPPRRGRSGKITAHSSSSSSSKSSTSLLEPNPTRNARISNPNLINTLPCDDYSKKANTQQRPLQQQAKQQDGEEDLLISPSLVGTCPFYVPRFGRDVELCWGQVLGNGNSEDYATKIPPSPEFGKLVMIPMQVEEMMQRERLRDLSVFERLNGIHGKSSPSLVVKKFCRTMSTKNIQASNVRPLPVLEDTLNYLLNFLDSKEHPFEVVHDFIFDRTRSIRQDLSMQNIINNRVIQMFEKMVKFHVVSHHKLRRCSDSQNISSIHYLNMEQLTKVLTSLYHLYEANRNSQSIYEKEAEFHSLYVLLHLNPDSKLMGEPLSFWFRHPPPFVKSKEMYFARRVLRYYRFGNFKRFIHTTAADASYLQFCIIEPYINEVRALAVSCVNYGGYKLHPYPLEGLSKLLMMKESDMESFCRDCGLETSTDQGKKFLPTKQISFSRPKEGFNYCVVGLKLFEVSGNSPE